MQVKAMDNKATIQRVGTLGLMMQAIGFAMHSRTAGLILAFSGLGVSFWSLKVLYEVSESRKMNTYELFPKSGSTGNP